MYRYIDFKIYISIKQHWWSLTSSWPNEVQRIFSTIHEFSKIEIEPQMILWLILYMSLRVNNYYYIIFTDSLNKRSSFTQSYLSLFICILIFLWSSLSFYMLTLVFFNSAFQVTVGNRFSSWWIKRTTSIFELGSIYIYLFIPV